MANQLGQPVLHRRNLLLGMGGAGLAAAATVLARSSLEMVGAQATATAAAPPAAGPFAGSPPAAVTVQMTDQPRFDPATVTISVGQTVTWVNNSAIPHSSTDDPTKNPVQQTFPQYAVLPTGAAPWDSG